MAASTLQIRHSCRRAFSIHRRVAARFLLHFQGESASSPHPRFVHCVCVHRQRWWLGYFVQLSDRVRFPIIIDLRARSACLRLHLQFCFICLVLDFERRLLAVIPPRSCCWFVNSQMRKYVFHALVAILFPFMFSHAYVVLARRITAL